MVLAIALDRQREGPSSAAPCGRVAIAAQLTSEGGLDTASNAALMTARCSAVSGVTGSGMYGVRVLENSQNEGQRVHPLQNQKVHIT